MVPTNLTDGNSLSSVETGIPLTVDGGHRLGRASRENGGGGGWGYRSAQTWVHTRMYECVYMWGCAHRRMHMSVYIQNKTLSLGLLKNFTVGIFYLDF